MTDLCCCHASGAYTEMPLLMTCAYSTTMPACHATKSAAISAGPSGIHASRLAQESSLRDFLLEPCHDRNAHINRLPALQAYWTEVDCPSQDLQRQHLC